MKVNCKNCGKEFNKFPKEIRKSPNHYCSRSCAAITNNKTCPKRQKEGLCINCNTPTSTSRQKCPSCIKNASEEFINKTKKETEYVNPKNLASRWTRIREHARKVAGENGMTQKPCARCGFAEHVQICHIKPISHFLDSDQIKDINCITNLIQLCPNCHWLFDHGKINL